MSKASRSPATDGAAVEQTLALVRGLETTSVEAALRAALAAEAGDDETRSRNADAFAAAPARVAEALAAIHMDGGEAALDGAATRAVSTFVERLNAVGERLERGERPSSAELQALADFAVDELRGALSAHLTRLEDASAREKRSSATSSKEARAVIDSAVDEIDQISLNVRLISLNASVEAARAGEAGRGFGVIASEIQNLATRSQGAVESVRRQLASIG